MSQKSKEAEELGVKILSASDKCFAGLWEAASEFGLTSMQISKLKGMAQSSEKVTDIDILNVLRNSNEN